ncbi:MAG TPA: thioredoxin family protein [Chloroflexota bacterium]|jgi:hypothetical protein
MAVTRERFEQGMTYQQYRDQMTRNKERFEQNEKTIQFAADDLAAFTKLARPLNVVAIAEDWCGDVIANLPILGRLAEQSGKLNVRVFLRDQNDDLMQQYLNRGEYKSIPVFAFFDEGFKEIGNFKERPDSVTELRARRRTEIYQSDPAFGDPSAPMDQLPEDVRTRLQGEMQKLRDDTTSFANAEVVKALRAIVEKAG